MHWLNERLIERGHKICFMAEYYLADVSRIPDASCNYETRILEQPDFEEYYFPEWSHALCKERKELDVLGVGAYDDGKLIGLAACSADCEDMWQIGIDVLPSYRRRGIARVVRSYFCEMTNEEYAAFGIKNCEVMSFRFDQDRN